MKENKLLTAVFILALLLLIGAQSVKLARANGYLLELGTVPPDAYTKPPKISLSAPVNGSLYTTNAILLSIRVDVPESSTADYTMVHDIRCQTDWQQEEFYLYLNEGLYNSIESRSPLPDHHYFQGSKNFTGIPDGNHSILITVDAGGFYLKAGELGFYRFAIKGFSSVFFGIDATPPRISGLSIENKTYRTTDIPLNFTVNEPNSQVVYSLDGQKNVTIAGNTTLTNLPFGEHNVTVYATDNAGNTGTSEAVCFTVKEPEPFPTAFVAVASITSVIVIGIGLLVYFKKRKR